MSVYESSRKMTANEKMCYDMGYAKAKQDMSVKGSWIESGKITKCSICGNPAVYTMSGRLDKTTYCGLCGARLQ